MCYSLGMRQTVSISLSPLLKKEIDEIVESGMYSSTSELIRDAVRTLKETRLITELKKSQTAARSGKVTKLTSLKSLR